MDKQALKQEYAALAHKYRWARYQAAEETRESILDNARMTAISEALKGDIPVEPLVRPVPEVNREAFLKDIASINRRAAKLGCEPISIEWGPEVIIEFTKPLTREEEYEIAQRYRENPIAASMNPPERKKVKAKCQLAYMTGEPPKLPGWELIGVIEPLPTGENLFRPAPGRSFPEDYRKISGTYCDHCKADRKRKDTVLIRHESGEYKQVGRSCIKDFFHGHNPATLLFHAEQYFKLERYFSPPGDMHNDWDYSIGLVDFLAHVHAVFKKDGRFITSTEARNENMYENRSTQATGSKALSLMALRTSLKAEDLKDYQESAPGESDQDIGRKTFDWILATSSDSEFMTNLRTLFKVGAMTRKHANLAAWAVKGYLKNVERLQTERARIKVQGNGGHVGELKKRQAFTARYLPPVSYVSNGNYGEPCAMMIHKFLDAAGNVLTWNTAASANLTHKDLEEKEAYSLEIGAEYEFKGTPKRHGEYKGVKETNLSRVVIVKQTAPIKLKELEKTG